MPEPLARLQRLPTLQRNVHLALVLLTECHYNCLNHMTTRQTVSQIILPSSTASPSPASPPSPQANWHTYALYGGMTAAWLVLAVSSHGQIAGWMSITLLAVIWSCWVILWRRQHAQSMVIITTLAVVFRLIAWAADPIFENDWIRYLWDGYTFVTLGSPYDHVPLDHFSDPQAETLFAEQLDHFGYPEIPTIYGPVAMVCFAVSHVIAAANLAVLKIVFGVIELLSLWFARQWLSQRAWQAYALCPLIIFEGWMNVHLDVLALGLGMLGLTCLLNQHNAKHGASQFRRYLVAGVFLGLAVACRLQALPFVILLCWWHRSVPLAIISAAVTLGCYAPFFVSGSWAGLDVSKDFLSWWMYNAIVLQPLSWLIDPQVARWMLLSLAGLTIGWWAWRGALRRRYDSPAFTPAPH